MKKSLIALAVASVVSAPAFAATSNVDVYGKLHVSVSMFDDQQESGGGHVGTNDIQFSSNASRIGFKGAEDLGGGLAAIWQIENGIDLDEGNGTWASRNSFVGLKGGWGTVLLGKHDTPLKLVGRTVDLFGDTMADSRNVMGGGSDTRAENVLAYISPNFSGFSVAAAYSTDPFQDGSEYDNKADADEMSVYNLNATYNNGPLYVGVGYGDGDGHEALGLGAHWRVAAGYTFGNFKLVGQYDSLEEDVPVAVVGDYDAWMVGGSYTMGAMVFKANYMEGEFDNVDNFDINQWTLGMDYNLSKRTALYALYASGENVVLGSGGGSSDQIAPGDSRFAPAGWSVGTNEDVSVFSIGMTHSF